MPILIKEEGDTQAQVLPPAPPPPPVAPTGGIVFTPIVDTPHGVPGVSYAGVNMTPPPLPPPLAPVDVPPDHRGLPQPGDVRADLGPIVAPHGAPSPSATDSGGDGGGGGDGGAGSEPGSGATGDRTLASAADSNDHRVDAAHAWLHFQQFFAGGIPHASGQITKLRQSLPKVVG